MPALIDTHCHLDLGVFDTDRLAVLQRAREAGIERMVVPSLDVTSSETVVRLTNSTRGLYAAIGVHPTSLDRWSAKIHDQLRGISKNSKVLAIGEIGLDYYWDASRRAQQLEALRGQLLLAEELGLPVILHMREQHDAVGGKCSDDLVLELAQWVSRLRQRGAHLGAHPGVLHSFSGSLEVASEAIRLGFTIGVCGSVTYSKASDLRALIAALPTASLVLETDSPFQTPVPHRGRRNEPAFLMHIADRIARMHSISRAEVARITSENAARLFAWGIAE
jgi:TatD DNase family protein